MKCPVCGEIEDKVIDSRLAKDNTEIRRRRQCLNCMKRFTTYDRIIENAFDVLVFLWRHTILARMPSSNPIFFICCIGCVISLALTKNTNSPYVLIL